MIPCGDDPVLEISHQPSDRGEGMTVAIPLQATVFHRTIGFCRILSSSRRRLALAGQASGLWVVPGLVESMATLASKRAVIVIPEGNPYPLSESVTAIGLRPFLESLT